MAKPFVKYVSALVLISFVSMAVMSPVPAFAQVKTVPVKIFSEIKGIEIFIDDKSQGTDISQIDNVEVGSHYLKAVKDGVTIYSQLVNVPADAATTVLIQDTGQVKQKIIESKYKEQQEYKSKKLDILLTKNMNTTGTSYTYSNYFPGYYSIFAPSWTTNSSSVATETTDWKIVQGGVQEISEATFASLTGDTGLQSRIDKASKDWSDRGTLGAIIGLTGLIVCGAGIYAACVAPVGKSTSDDSTLILPVSAAVVGLLATIAGYAMCSTPPPGGHFINPQDAAKDAYNYNQKLKTTLGLPADFEPVQ